MRVLESTVMKHLGSISGEKLKRYAIISPSRRTLLYEVK
jgi:hypothetical protein